MTQHKIHRLKKDNGDIIIPATLSKAVLLEGSTNENSKALDHHWKSYDIDSLRPVRDENYTLTTAIESLISFVGKDKRSDWRGTELSFHDGSDFCTYTFSPPIETNLDNTSLKNRSYWVLTGGTKYINSFNSQFSKLDDEFNKYLLSKSKFYAVEWDGRLSTSLARGKLRTAGDPTFLDSLWSFFLIDTTQYNEVDGVIDRSSFKPVGRLRKNNLLRFKDGSFAPVIQISKERWDTCMTNALYRDPTASDALYCIAGQYDPIQAYKDFRKNYNNNDKVLYYRDSSGIHSLTYWDLVKPWETTDSKYSIVVANEKPIWFLDNVVSPSTGNIWTGIFTTPGEWDGIELEEFKIPISSMTLCKCSLNYDKDKVKRGGLVGRFSVLGITSENRKRGTALYPETNLPEELIKLARLSEGNTEMTPNGPTCEAQYQLWSAYITCQEMKFNTKYLSSRDMFTSGISSVNSCSNLDEYNSHGGVRTYYKDTSGQYDLSFSNFSRWPDRIITQKGSDTRDGRTGLSYYFNDGEEAPKEMCMESQMALSYASELSINPKVDFSFYKNTYRYETPANAPSSSLKSGHLNAILYTKETRDITTNLIEYNLRMAVCGGVSVGFDTGLYLGGTEYILAPGVTENDTNEEVPEIKVQTYQCWDLNSLYIPGEMKSPDVSKVDIDRDFPFQKRYLHMFDKSFVNNSGWIRHRQPYSVFPSISGGTDSTGEGVYYNVSSEIPRDNTKKVRLQATLLGSAVDEKSGIRTVRITEWNTYKAGVGVCFKIAHKEDPEKGTIYIETSR